MFSQAMQFSGVVRPARRQAATPSAIVRATSGRFWSNTAVRTSAASGSSSAIAARSSEWNTR